MRNKDSFEDELHRDSTNFTDRGSKLPENDAACGGHDEAPQTFNERYEALLECLTKEQLLGELIKVRRELTRFKKAEAERQELDEDPVTCRKVWTPLGHATKAIWETKEGYRILFQRAKEPMYIVSVYGTLIDANDSWEAIFGYHKSEVLGLCVDDVLRLSSEESLGGHPGQRWEERSFRAVARKMDGSEIDCLITSTAWEDDEGEIFGYANSVREWSPRPDAGGKGIAVRTDDLEERASLALLSGIIAHEVKSPLAAVLQGIEFIRGSLPENDTLLDAVQRIEEAALRVIRVTERLLELSDRSEPKREVADLRLVVERALFILDDQMRRKSIEIRKRYAPDVPPVRVDITQIEEVFANILLNATEAVQTHGIIEVGLEREKGEAGSIWVKVTFSDNGQGVPREDMARIFAPFFTSKKATGGIGLGLTISKKIIEKHGGTILIEGRAGGGTSVTVRLPEG